MTSTAPTRTTYVNLPVKDLGRAVAFFTELGFTLAMPVNEQSAFMVISDGANLMLHTEAYFAEFTQSEIVDTATSKEVAVGLSAVSRQEVDDLVDTAVTAGGRALGEPQDQGFMYMRAFVDLDGHQWSLIYMDAAMSEQG